MNPLRLSGLVPILCAAQGAILFEDNFDRPDSRNIQAELTGITNNTGSPFTAGTVYSQPFLDPNNAAPAFGVQDASATNGGGAQIIGSNLQLAVGTGTSNAYVNHNFTNPGILANGGFSVELDVLGYTQISNGQGGGFAIGMSQAEASSTGDAFDGAARMTGGFQTAINTPVPTQNVSDFWVVLRGNNTLVWGGKSGNVLGTANNISSKVGNLAANFRFADFNAGSAVTYQVILNGVLIGTGSFTWSEDASNFIGIDARDNTAVSFDNFRVGTDFVDPLIFPPTITAFEPTRLQGSNDTRFHWRVLPGTVGDPVTITIRDGGTVVHTTNTLAGFADVNTAGAASFILNAANSHAAEELGASIPPDNGYATAIRADNPTAWYRFNEAFGSPLIVDSANNPTPHNGSPIGPVTTGNSGPLGGAATFGGAGSILTNFILNPATIPTGHTVEAIVRRHAGSPTSAAIVSQMDGTTTTGRSHLAVDSDGTIQTFLAGGPPERKDADAKLPPDIWAHLTMVVDKATPEIRWYLDGVLIGSTSDGTNPDGSTFNPAFTVEPADGAWRIGTQKLADQNFWLGDMEEVVIYDKLLDDPDGNGDRSDSRVAVHSDAWFAAASGLLGIAAAAETIDPGGNTTLTIKVGADVTSVSVDQGIGTVAPVNGIITIPVSPAATTTYTVTVEGPAGTQTQTVTVTVVEVPATPPSITATRVNGSNVEVDFLGTANTQYLVRGSLGLESFDLDHGTATTGEDGSGTAIIPLVPGRGRQFYRIEESP